MASLNFNANEVPPLTEWEPVPAGDYKAQIIQSEYKQTKNGDGRYLEFQIEIIDGEHKGQKLFDRLNVENPKQQTVDIALRTLSSICHAVGKLSVSDSEQLHFIPFNVRVKVEPRKDDPSKYTNRVSYLEPGSGQQQRPTQAVGQPGPTQQGQSWQRPTTQQTQPAANQSSATQQQAVPAWKKWRR